jgi:predicted TIM-barrel fold metal-dependent hydrolase
VDAPPPNLEINTVNDRLKPAQLSRSAAVKAKLDHPVIDTDVHTIDYTPLLEDYVAKYGGTKLVDQFRNKGAARKSGSGKSWYEQTPEERHYYRSIRSPWWGRVTRNTLDLATYAIPELLYQRQDEYGSDYSVLFPNGVLAAGAVRDSDARRAIGRAINHYHADTFRKYADRLTPVAGISLHTPQEGVEELEFAINELGLKVVNISGAVRRPIKAVADKYPPAHHPDVAKYASYLDFYGLDSEYDYDPFWAKAVELGVPITTHFGSQGWTGRASTSNYMNNHIGHFADGSEAFARSLFFGGVTKRFPKLRVGMLEAGAAWGASVYIHLVDRLSKRSPEALENYNFAHLDRALLTELFQRHGQDLIGKTGLLDPETLADATLQSAGSNHRAIPKPDEFNDFGKAGIESVEDIKARWVDNFFFGSESDDRTLGAAFNTRANPLGVKVNAIYSSDVGHWDVPEFTDPLADSWGLVEDGVITAEDFKAYVFDNPYKLYTEAKPDFFKGTAVEAKLKARQAAAGGKA